MRLPTLFAFLLLPLLTASLGAQTHSWTNGLGGDWNLGTNWSTGTVPNGAGDSPGITLTGPGPYTIDMNIDVLMNDFNFAPSNGTLLVSGQTVTMNGSGSLGATGGSLLQMRGSTWTGPGTLTNQTTIETRGTSRFERLLQIGTLNAIGSATHSSGNLTLDNIVNNTGNIYLDSIDAGYNSSLTISPGGRLDNAGVFEVRTGTGGNRNFIGALRNTNSVIFGHPTNLSGGPIEQISGTFLIAPTHLVTLATTTDFDLQGGMLLIDGEFLQNSALFTMTGGDMTGKAQLRNGTLDLNATGTALFQLEGTTTLTGNTAAAQEVRVVGLPAAGTGSLTIPNHITNDGNMRLSSEGSGYTANITMGSGMRFTNANSLIAQTGAGGARNFHGELYNEGTFQTETNTTMNTGPFTNKGTWTINAGTTLTMSTGTDFVHESGTMNVLGDLVHLAGTNSYLGGTIDGAPEFRSGTHTFGAGFNTTFTPIWGGATTLSSDIPAGTTVRLLGQPATGTATLTAAADRTLSGVLRLDSEGSGYTSSWSGLGTTLTNLGTLSSLVGAAGARNFNGSLSNQGNVEIFANTTFNTGTLANDGTWLVDSAATMTVNGAQGFTQNSGSFTLDGALIQNSGPANFYGGTLSGTPELRNTTLSFAPAFSAPASLLVIGSTELLTDVPAATNLTLQGAAAGGTQTLTVSNDTNMAGTASLTSIGAGYSSVLTVAPGSTLTQSGTLRSEVGAGGARTMNGTLRNTGTMEFEASTAHNAGTVTNEATLTVLPGATLTMNASTNYVQQSGVVDNQGTFLHLGGVNDFFGGTIQGSLDLRSSILNFDAGFTSPILLHLDGATTFTGAVVSGQELTLAGNASGGSQSFTANAGLEMGGRIMLTSEGAGYASSMTVNGGPLHNTGQFRVEKGAGGTRTITGQFDNEGVLSVLDNTAAFNGAGLNNMQGGTLRGDGTVNVSSSGGLQNNGDIQPGEGIGSMSLTGDLFQGPDGIVSIQLGGTTPDTEYDVLNLSGDANLDGEVHLRLENGFLPAYGDQFTILNASSINGEFTAARIRGGQLATGLGFDLVHTSNSVIAQVVRVINLPPGGISQTPVMIQDPVPGLAGQNNVFQINSVTGGSLVELVFGLALGTTVIGGCPDDYGIQSAQVLGTAIASSNGTAMMTVLIPGAAAGTTGYFQAFDMASCRLSAVKAIVFP